MPREIIGMLDGKGMRVAIAVARFNSQITDRLLEGALDALRRNHVADGDVTVVRCPGSWELPLVCQRLAANNSADAVLALGCLIRGETPHFDYIAAECAKGVAQVGMQSGVPVVFGVLTTDTVDQAMDRAGLKSGNKGFEAAVTAIEMVNVMRAL